LITGPIFTVSKAARRLNSGAVNGPVGQWTSEAEGKCCSTVRQLGAVEWINKVGEVVRAWSSKEMRQ
jgi:hypothetical protein